jgi:acetyltransferase-like isoleucine patch superfamily enzyme
MTQHVVLSHDWWPKGLPSNVQIGERTWLHSAYAFAHYCSEEPVGVRIGNDCGVYINTLFDLGPIGSVVIGDYCTIVGLIVSTNAKVSIGNYTFIAHDVHIADSGAPVPPASRNLLDRDGGSSPAGVPEIVLGEAVWIGARAVILPGARIGDGAIVGASTVVDFEVPAEAVVAGDPPRIVGSARDAAREADVDSERRGPHGGRR